jgi:hypothetical protein
MKRDLLRREHSEVIDESVEQLLRNQSKDHSIDAPGRVPLNESPYSGCANIVN